jgi:hypothetical protein
MDDWDLGSPVGSGRRREDCLTFVAGRRGDEGKEMSQGYRDVTSSYERRDESNHTGDASIARSRRGKWTQEDPNWSKRERRKEGGAKKEENRK